MDIQKHFFDIYSGKTNSAFTLRDKYDRDIVAGATHTLLEPVVSNFLFESGFRPQYPGGYPFAVCLSHDIDLLYKQESNKPVYYGGFKNIANISLYEVKRRLMKERQTIHNEWCLSRLIHANEKANARSSYYFLSLAEDEEDYNYVVTDPFVIDYFSQIKESRSEIGLHGGHRAYNNADKIAVEKNKLQESAKINIVGYRNHYLRMITPETWVNLRNNHFLYDTTFGFAGSAGFRNGMCYPFRPYDASTGQYLDIVEIPLHIMDVSLFQYMDFSKQEIMDFIKLMVQKIKRVNGVLTILWHNDKMTNGLDLVYTEILDYLQNQDACFMTGRELVSHYKEQDYFSKMESVFGV